MEKKVNKHDCFWCDKKVAKKGELCHACEKRKNDMDKQLDDIEKEYTRIFGGMDCIDKIALHKSLLNQITLLSKALDRAVKLLDGKVTREGLLGVAEHEPIAEGENEN